MIEKIHFRKDALVSQSHVCRLIDQLRLSHGIHLKPSSMSCGFYFDVERDCTFHSWWLARLTIFDIRKIDCRIKMFPGANAKTQNTRRTHKNQFAPSVNDKRNVWCGSDTPAIHLKFIDYKLFGCHWIHLSPSPNCVACVALGIKIICIRETFRRSSKLS